MQTQYTTSLDAINVAHVLLNLSDSGKISFNLYLVASLIL